MDRFQKTVYDLLVIGGGINGAAIAHLAAKRGMKVALLEKGDFASGTSSKSTKLIHGGIRYLENFEVDLVYESLKERKIQLRAAPHLVKPLAFVIPVYYGDKRPLWMMRLGVFLYDLIAGPYKVQKHKALTAEEVIKLEPGIKKEGLKGGVLYYDAQMDDARLCLENVLSAAEYGADVANYVKVASFIKENGRTVGVKAHDMLGIKEFEVHAKKVVCTVGPWTNGLLRLDSPDAKKKVRTTKGIHIVYKGQISQHALLIGSQSDRRIFFVIPWMGNSLIGTTDTDYIGSPDTVKVEQEDIDYLIRESRHVFPDLDFGGDKIITTFAGLRPLVRKGGSASQVSRKHLFYESPSGVVFVVGGKYTTYRKVAEDCLNKLFGRRGTGTILTGTGSFSERKGACPFSPKWSQSPNQPVPFTVYGSGAITESAEKVAREYGFETAVVQSLMDIYGIRYIDVLKLVRQNPALKEKICENPSVIKAQLVYSVQTEMARTVEDITERRLSLSFRGSISAKIHTIISEILG